MELKQFIAETLVSIVEGITDAQRRTKDRGAFINPGGLMRTTKAISENSIWDNRTNNFARLVSFDVAVTVEEGTKTDAKIGVVAGFFNLGAGWCFGEQSSSYEPNSVRCSCSLTCVSTSR